MRALIIAGIVLCGLLVAVALVLWGFAIWQTDLEFANRLSQTGILAFVTGVIMGVGFSMGYEFSRV